MFQAKGTASAKALRQKWGWQCLRNSKKAGWLGWSEWQGDRKKRDLQGCKLSLTSTSPLILVITLQVRNDDPTHLSYTWKTEWQKPNVTCPSCTTSKWPGGSFPSTTRYLPRSCWCHSDSKFIKFPSLLVKEFSEGIGKQIWPMQDQMPFGAQDPETLLDLQGEGPAETWPPWVKSSVGLEWLQNEDLLKQRYRHCGTC